MNTNLPRILVLVQHYLPGEKAGGPVQSIAGIVDALGGEFDFRLVTLNRDLGEGVPYKDVTPDVWTRNKGVAVKYLSRHGSTPLEMRRLLQATDCDLLYLNSLFSPSFSILPVLLRRLGLIPRVPLLLAPRGELSEGALALHSYRKKVFLGFAKAFGFHRDVYWLASTALEANEIRAEFPRARRIGVAMDFGPAPPDRPRLQAAVVEKRPGRLSVVFLSRIDRMKNLTGALEALGAMTGDVEFSIYGPKEDASYFAECERLIARLPSNIHVHYKGPVPHQEVHATFASHDLFLFPTHGENFGHVIFEALSAGCPVLLSDRTRWHGLEKASAGWELPLDDLEAFSAVLTRCVDAGPEEWSRMRAGARSFARLSGGRDAAIEEHRRVLSEATATT